MFCVYFLAVDEQYLWHPQDVSESRSLFGSGTTAAQTTMGKKVLPVVVVPTWNIFFSP